MTRKVKGAVAAGDENTAAAAVEVLQDGGNAYDAALAAMLAACISEPVLCSLGGGGFLMAGPSEGPVSVFDFFAQTPGQVPHASDIDFLGVEADFGAVRQEFHIGRGSVAVPGIPAGLFAVHDALGSLPLTRIIEPACRLAREGIRIAPLQAFILKAVTPIKLHSAEGRAIYESRLKPGHVLQAGELHRLPAFADVLEALVREGPGFFHEGDLARLILEDSGQGGSLSAADLANYRVNRRRPLERPFAGGRLLTNPLPSSGGALIAFALALIEGLPDLPDGHWQNLLAVVMEQTNLARHASGVVEDCTEETVARLFDHEFAAGYLAATRDRALKLGGTTHISVIDGLGNMAACTLSNGEGCGYILPGTGIMLNNMLGEEDINPRGFFNWRPGCRISSMMAPSLFFLPDGRRMALGSGGSNRIRSAILQVLCNMTIGQMPLKAAVEAPRIHFERGHLGIEHGHADAVVAPLVAEFDSHTLWPDQNFFFGGVHAVAHRKEGFDAAGDPRRGGVGIVL